MSDAPDPNDPTIVMDTGGGATPPPAGGDDGGSGPGGPGDDGTDGEDKPWYSQPATWIIAVILIIAAVIAIILLSDDDDTDVTTGTSTTTTSSTSTSSTTSSSTSSTTVASTTSTDTGETGGGTGGDLVSIAESEISAPVMRIDTTSADFPFEDGDVTAQWYMWDGEYVVVYAGWDATAEPTMCPGNSIELDTGFDFISNSPAGDGGCDPEDEFADLVPVDDDDSHGARVCDTLVIYRTVIPTMDDSGQPLEGNLYGTVERITDGEFVTATGAVPTDYDALTELDPDADGYEVPAGWLPDGSTEVSC